MGGVFRFKEFEVDQTGCGMKVNTDGVLLGALVDAVSRPRVLDIGTGTGVIALMLAQRFPPAIIDAVEIDKEAAHTALTNFGNSPFSSRLKVYEGAFQEYLRNKQTGTYDLIVSNPPFFLGSLKNNDHKKHTARHTDQSFFSDLIYLSARCLNPDGHLSLILPLPTAEAVEALAKREGLYVHNEIAVSSFPDTRPHRKMITFGFREVIRAESVFVIYQQEKQYSVQYRTALKDFLTIF